MPSKMPRERKSRQMADEDDEPHLTEDDDEPVKPPRKKARRTTFDDYFQALVTYNAKQGSTAQLLYAEDNSLYGWVTKARQGFNNKVTDEQRDRLLELHWETRQERAARYWNESFEKLKVYKQQHGNCLISSRFKEDPKLAAWVNTQRTAYKKETIHEDRKEKLESIGFVWRRYKLPKKPSDIFIESEAWILRYEKLMEYHHTQGHCLVPLDHKEEKSPAELTSAERVSSKPTLVKSLSSPEQARKVFNPTLKPEESWDTMMKRLLHFKHRNGHPDVPPNFTKWGLGEWVETQRAIGRNGELHWCKAERLIEVGLTWWGEED
jgi:hypothetical protein